MILELYRQYRKFIYVVRREMEICFIDACPIDNRLSVTTREETKYRMERSFPTCPMHSNHSNWLPEGITCTDCSSKKSVMLQ